MKRLARLRAFFLYSAYAFSVALLGAMPFQYVIELGSLRAGSYTDFIRSPVQRLPLFAPRVLGRHMSLVAADAILVLVLCVPTRRF